MMSSDDTYSSMDMSDSSHSSSSLSPATLYAKAKSRPAYPLCAVIAILSIIIVALAFALHSAQEERLTPVPPPTTASSTGAVYPPTAPPSPTADTTTPPPPPSPTSTPLPPTPSSTGSSSTTPTLLDFVTLPQLLSHAYALQAIADSNGGNRYIHLPGFNATVAYITQTLRNNTNFHVWHQSFTWPGFEVAGTPPLTVQDVDGDTITLTYGTDYNPYIFSRSLDCGSAAGGCPLAFVRYGGCRAADWAAASPGPVLPGTVVVVSRNTSCSLAALNTLAVANAAIGLIIHNNDPLTGLLALEGDATLATAMLTTTYVYGKLMELAIAGADPAFPPTLNVTMRTSYPPSVVTNVCADTVTGDPTSTIVIGSHSDGVITGSGIVDNGSGTCGNLVWAAAVSRLLQTPGFVPFPNRLRFCWWGAEEQGLRGSRYHVQQALNATDAGMRASDYQLNLNFDMIACPNFVFGVLNGSSGADFPATIPASVLNGSSALTSMYAQYFVDRRMPWDGKAFNGRSDYGPFLSAGIPAGGVSAFIDRVKTVEERDRYNRMLGWGMGGVPNVAIDPCYHQRCDTVDNLNHFAFEQIGKANAVVLEQLARMRPAELKRLMFPQLQEGEEKPLYEPKEWPVEDGQYE